MEMHCNKTTCYGVAKLNFAKSRCAKEWLSSESQRVDVQRNSLDVSGQDSHAQKLLKMDLNITSHTVRFMFFINRTSVFCNGIDRQASKC